jgi:hypothetical protein
MEHVLKNWYTRVDREKLAAEPARAGLARFIAVDDTSGISSDFGFQICNGTIAQGRTYGDRVLKP